MNKKSINIFGLICFLTLFFLSVIWYKERIIFFDTAFHLFSIIKDNDFAIQVNRFGAFITQIFPLIGLKLELSLEKIALLYSISFVVVYAIVFYYVIIYCKNVSLSVAILLINIVFLQHCFFWIQCELIQAIHITIAYLAYLEYALSKEKSKILLVSVLLIPFIVFFHPSAIFILVFGLLFFLNNNNNSKKELVVQILIAAFVTFLVKNIFFKNPYDTGSLSGLTNWKQTIFSEKLLQHIKLIASYFVKDYWLVSLMFIAVVFYYIKQNCKKHLFLLLGTISIYTLLETTTYNVGTYDFYEETRLLPLATFIIISFVSHVLPSLQTNYFVKVLIAGMLLVGFFKIFEKHKFYARRLEINRNIYKQSFSAIGEKLIIKAQNLDKGYLYGWGLSYEQWLISTIEVGKSASVMAVDSTENIDYLLNQNKSFITKWGAFDYDELNKKYFKFNDTSYYKKVD